MPFPFKHLRDSFNPASTCDFIFGSPIVSVSPPSPPGPSPSPPPPSPPGGGGDTLLYEFDRLNTSGSSTDANHLFPVLCKMGDVPTGSTLVLTDASDVDVPAGICNRVYYPDGSLKMAHVALRGTVSGSGTQDLKAKSRASSSYDDTDPATNFTTLLATGDWKMEFSSVTARYTRTVQIYNGQTSGTFPGFFKTGYTIVSVTANGDTWTNPTHYTVTNGSADTFQGQSGFDGITLNLASPASGDKYVTVVATWTHMSGAMLGKVTDGDVSGRIRKVISNPFVERWMTWAYVKDGSTGAGATDTHLKIYWYITRWRNSNGTQHSLFITPVVSLDEVYVENKVRFDYTVAFKNNTTTLETYASVQHPYRSQWAGVRQNNDAIHARAKCVSGSHDCWLITRPDKAYWASVEAFFPFDPTFTPTAVSLDSDNGTMTPCYNQSHRAFIDGTGYYEGRGIIPQQDARAFMSPTANHTRIARVAGLVGLHVPYHYRPAYGSSDPATLYPLILDTNDGVGDANAWNADGLPDAVYLSVDSRTNHFAFDYVVPCSDDGVWIPSGDTSHAVPYSGPSWIMEGEEYFNQANLDLMLNTSIQLVGDQYGSCRALMWSGVGGGWAGFSGFGIPTAQWSSLINLVGQERALAFALSVLGFGAGFAPAGRIENNFIAAFCAHQALYIERSLSYAPASMIANGCWIVREDGFGNPWQQNFNAALCVWAARCLRNQGFVDLADYMGTYAAGNFSRPNRTIINAYRGTFQKTAGTYHPTTNPYVSADHMLMHIECTTNATTNTFLTSTMNSDSPYSIQNGDRMWLSPWDGGGNSYSLPGYLSQSVEYFVVNRSNPSGTTVQFQLSLTLGGGAIDITGGNATAMFYLDNVIADGGAGTGTDNGGNGYSRIAHAALIMHAVNGHALVNDALVDSADDYLSGVSWLGDPGWRLARLP